MVARPTRGAPRRELLRETLVVAEAVRKSMRGNRSRGTKPELVLRKSLWDCGLRGYRLNVRGLPGTPDIVFTRKRLAIFVHGCYWHGCPKCSNYRLPRTNAAFWAAKLDENTARDRRAEEALIAMGFQVLVIWECEIGSDPFSCVQRVARELAGERPAE